MSPDSAAENGRGLASTVYFISKENGISSGGTKEIFFSIAGIIASPLRKKGGWGYEGGGRLQGTKYLILLISLAKKLISGRRLMLVFENFRRLGKETRKM